MTACHPEQSATPVPLRPRGPIVTVTANPALDLTYQVPKLVPGASHRVSAPLLRAGGKGLNVARVVHQAGHQAFAVAPVGGATGAEFRAELVGSGVPHELTEVAADTRRSMAFVDGEAGQTSIFNEAGWPLTDADWDALHQVVERNLTGAGVLVGSGSLPEGTSPDFYSSLVRRARAHGLRSIIDTSGGALLAAADAGADFLKPNHQELLEATGSTTISGGARILLDRGAGTVMVSCGEHGMYLYRLNEPPLQATLPRFEGNPTGAGDAAVAAIAVVLAAGITSGETLLRLATAWSAAAVLMPAAGELDAGYRVLERTVSIGQADQQPSNHHQPHQEAGA
ncbi:hexose kinase [Arthrobacter sp. H20]|uniref:1-phosphofructokinase family hexose kinase n=1 Tax=Arthrobacter sp. H20 TaxID=1267981 RepID=UPI0004BB70DC|nr:hexose kinase [Arthrobacter sp. H20]